MEFNSLVFLVEGKAPKFHIIMTKIGYHIV